MSAIFSDPFPYLLFFNSFFLIFSIPSSLSLLFTISHPLFVASPEAFISVILKFSSFCFSWAPLEKWLFSYCYPIISLLNTYISALRYCIMEVILLVYSVSSLGKSLFLFMMLIFSMMKSFLRNVLCLLLYFSSILSFFFSCSMDSLPIHFVVELFLDKLFSWGWYWGGARVFALCHGEAS